MPTRIAVDHPVVQPSPAIIEELAGIVGGRPGLIVCSEQPAAAGFAEALTALSAHLDCPVLAEPLSNLRFGSHDRQRICVRYANWLSDARFKETHRPEWLLHFGAVPVGRPLQNLLASASRALIQIEPWPRWTDPAHRTTHLVRADPTAVCQALLARQPAPSPAGWMNAFADRDAAASDKPPVTHIATLLEEVAAGASLFIGNSLAIRQVDEHSGAGEKPLRFFANRGASGIDGNISTAIGIAAAHSRVVALLGDLTCQHDLGGLALARDRDVVIVVVNNGGGGIFDGLPQAALPEFEYGWRTPQRISFAHAASTFGLGYASADNDHGFRKALRAALKTGGAWLIELVVDNKSPSSASR